MPAPLLRLHDVPHLGLAELPFVFQGVFVRGVHLHRKVFLGVDELDEHGEKREFRRVFAPVRLGRDVAQQPAVFEAARSRGVEGKLPTLRDAFFIARFSVIFQLVSAPDEVLRFGEKFFDIHFATSFILLECAAFYTRGRRFIRTRAARGTYSTPFPRACSKTDFCDTCAAARPPPPR